MFNRQRNHVKSYIKLNTQKVKLLRYLGEINMRTTFSVSYLCGLITLKQFKIQKQSPGVVL